MKKFESMMIAAENALANNAGEAYVDSGVKILIAVVIGALLLAGLFLLFDQTILPEVTEKVQAIFDTTLSVPGQTYSGVTGG